jgi:hypothetical protein
LTETKEEKRKRGKKSRASGKKFENKVREDLESRGYIVCKWTNTVDLVNRKLIAAKAQYNPFFKRIVGEGSGFPDYIAFKKKEGNYVLFGVESKKIEAKTKLDKKEREMATWLLDNNVFPKIYVAVPIKRGRKTQVVYQKFER